jgi:hypothetical protein
MEETIYAMHASSQQPVGSDEEFHQVAHLLYKRDRCPKEKQKLVPTPFLLGNNMENSIY